MMFVYELFHSELKGLRWSLLTNGAKLSDEKTLMSTIFWLMMA